MLQTWFIITLATVGTKLPTDKINKPSYKVLSTQTENLTNNNNREILSSFLAQTDEITQQPEFIRE